MANAINIKLMYNSSNFSDLELPSDVTTVGHLKRFKEAEGSNVTVNVNGVERADDALLTDGAFVAIVTTNKLGG